MVCGLVIRISSFRNLRRHGLIAALFVFLLALPALALEPDRPLAEYGHRVWLSSQSGLPQDNVNCILQTRDGYLWFGTNEGAVRFDGVHFTTFDHFNTPELRMSAARTMIEDREGRLWIGSNSGQISYYKDGRFTPFAWSIEPANILAIFQDHEGSIWFGTDDGLFVYRDGQVKEIGAKDGLTSRQIWAIAEDSRQRLWIGTGGGGLLYWQGGKLIPVPRGESGDFVTSLVVDGENLWVGALPGLHLLHNGVSQSFPAQSALSRESIAYLYKDREGYLWVGTRHSGLRRVSPQGGVSAYRSTGRLSSDEVTSILEDTGGSLWIGTRGAGLNQLRDVSVQTMGARENLDGFNRALIQDNHGDMWIATNTDGLRKIHHGKVEAVGGTSSAFVRSLFVDTDNSLWVGTDQGELNHILPNGHVQVFTSKDGLIDGSAKSMIRARDGSLWISTSRGVSRYFQGKFTNFTVADGLAGKEVAQILEAHDGTLWFATSGGLSGYRNGRFFASITDKDGFSSKLLRCLYEDKEGVLWIGTRDGGLNRLKGGKITVYNRAAGLAEDVVFSILEDDRQNLWMSSTRGIFRASKKELNDFAEGRIHSITSVAYGVDDGMLAAECSGNVQPAAWKARDGRLWYPTINGVAILDPGRARADSPRKATILEQVLIDKQQIPLSSAAVVVPPGQGELEFEYTAIDFTAPENIRFKYKLEGFDHDWVEARSRRVAYYTNIPPGNYRFRVAVLGAGQTEADTAEISLRLLPHYYQARWFWAACLLLGAATAFGIYRWVFLMAVHRVARGWLQTENDQRQAPHGEFGAHQTAPAGSPPEPVGVYDKSSS
jgi:ligand-binding sensor domain-containing protein